MSMSPLTTLEWRQGDELLVATEPTRREVEAAAARLAGYYNDPHNSRMMAHEGEMSPAEVVAYYEDLRGEGGRPFLLERAAGAGARVLMGDADLRNIDGGTGEFAIMIGARDVQGRGLGTRFALMVHAFAFQRLGLERVYVSIIEANAASRRLFEKLGYLADDGPAAREFADDDTDLTLSIERAAFEAARARELAEIRVHERAVDQGG
jgi:RimJ/RimL family protein N-acetyltransferase